MNATNDLDVDDLPPSAKYVVFVLEHADGSLPRGDLRDRTDLPERTLDRALDKLENKGVIRRDRDTDDLRYVRIQFE